MVPPSAPRMAGLAELCPAPPVPGGIVALHKEAGDVIRPQSEVRLLPLQKSLQKFIGFPCRGDFILLYPELQGGQNNGHVQRVKNLKT